VVVPKAKSDLDVFEFPFLDELKGPVNKLEVEGLARIVGPMIWTLKIKSGLNLSQNCSHTFSLFSPKPELLWCDTIAPNEIISIFNAMPVFRLKNGPQIDLWAWMANFHSFCVKIPRTKSRVPSFKFQVPSATLCREANFEL
jgi:hypothetical protein